MTAHEETRRGHTHAAARQVSQGRERLLAKHDLRRIDIQRQQLHPMLFAQALFQKRPECRHAELETGAVRVQTGKVRRRVLGVVGRHGAHQHRAERHHTQLQQAQQVGHRRARTADGFGHLRVGELEFVAEALQRDGFLQR